MCWLRVVRNVCGSAREKRRKREPKRRNDEEEGEQQIKINKRNVQKEEERRRRSRLRRSIGRAKCLRALSLWLLVFLGVWAPGSQRLRSRVRDYAFASGLFDFVRVLHIHGVHEDEVRARVKLSSSLSWLTIYPRPPTSCVDAYSLLRPTRTALSLSLSLSLSHSSLLFPHSTPLFTLLSPRSTLRFPLYAFLFTVSGALTLLKHRMFNLVIRYIF